MAANQNVLQLTQQTVSANSTSVFYAVINSTTDTGIPLSVLVNNLGLTGIPTTPTAASNTNTTQIASCAFVQSVAGAYAPLSGATFTGTVSIPTLTITGSIGGSALSTYLSSPPPIGNTTPGSGAFTTLSASNTVSGTGFSTYLASPPAIGSTTPNTGQFTTLQATGAITPSSTAGIVGTTTNNNANAGSVGEFPTPTNLSGVSLTSATATNVASISLTAGDWDVSGVVRYNPGGSATTSNIGASISTTSATFGSFGMFNALLIPFSSVTGGNSTVSTPTVRILVASTTTVYLVALCTFSASTMTADGFIRARRMR